MEAWRQELYHYGMPRRSGRYKWGSGDRPFQGMEGGIKRAKLTKEQRKELANKAFSRTQKQGKDKPNISPAESMVKNTKSIVNNAEDIARKANDIRNRKKDQDRRKQFQSEASKMSNDELRKAVERMNLEDAYVSKKSSRYSDGKNKALEILDYAGDVTSIALAVVGIAATVNELRKKK